MTVARYAATDFPAQPPLECDVIMKGGITSGVLYPHLVCELARVYRFRSVGGASAGAIAAAAAAASEVGRQRLAAGTVPPEVPTSEVGFLNIAEMPAALTATQPDGRSTLFHLFRPQEAFGTLFGLATSLMDESAARKAKGRKLTAVPVALRLWRSYPWRKLLWLLPGLLVLAVAATVLADHPSLARVVAGLVVVLLGLLLLLVAALAGAATGLLGDVGRLGDEGFGLTRGMGGQGELALTPWLHERLQRAAGHAAADAPLTFGELAGHGVTLRMMTTNVTRSEPLTMPWEGAGYWFDPAYFATLFPADVVKAMVDHPPPLPTQPAKRFRAEVIRQLVGPLRPWPEARDLPVVVATRMSLSFPVLIAAVRLGLVDFTAQANRDVMDRVDAWRGTHPDGTVQECATAVGSLHVDDQWFSDGGLTANLPVHFFDGPLPSRPTFAVDLATYPAGQSRSADEADNSFLPTQNNSGMHRRSADWSGKHGLGALGTFAWSLIVTARSWLDESQLVRPGYRDRLVTIYHDGDEGGMNLAMPVEVVDGLTARGREAGRKLVEAFAGPEPGTTATWAWRNHRWLRLRLAGVTVGDYLSRLKTAYEAPNVAGADYPTLLAGPDLPSYDPGVGARGELQARLAALMTEVPNWQAAQASLDNQAPHPVPILRLASGDPRHDGA